MSKVSVTLVLPEPVGELRLNNRRDALRWVELELAWGDRMAGAFAHVPQAALKQSWGKARAPLISAREELEAATDSEVVERHLVEAARWIEISARDPRAAFLSRLQDNGVGDQVLGLTLEGFFRPAGLAQQIANPRMQGEDRFKALSYAASFEAGSYDTASQETLQETRRALDEVASELARARDQVDELVAAGEKWADDRKQARSTFAAAARLGRRLSRRTRDGSVRKLKELEDWYREQLALESPSRYWSDQATLYLDRSNTHTTFFYLFLLSSVFAVVGLVGSWVVPELRADPGAYWPLLLLSVFVAALTWPLRLLSRLALTYRHLGEDAAERAMIAKTYRALFDPASPIGETERSLMLAALFRNASSGLVKEDGSPDILTVLASRLTGRD